jgi:DNA-binding IclR family transcriptional regulator
MEPHMPGQAQRKTILAKLPRAARHEKRRIPTAAAARAMAILHAASASDHGQSAADLAHGLRLPVATVKRLLEVLEHAGYMQREPGGKRFIAGHKLTEMAIVTLVNSPQREARRSILRALADEIQQSCAMAMVAGDSIVLIDSIGVDGSPPERFAPLARHPLHCTAAGKLLLSAMPTLARRRLIASAPLKQFTDRTIVDPLDIERAVKRILSTGVGVDDGEFIKGMGGIAVPVVDAEGRMIAVVATHALMQRIETKQMMKLAPALSRASAAIAKTFHA